jgi:flagellar basal body rod protein FlgG
MDAGRGSYICGLVLGIAVGVAGTHVALSGGSYSPVRLPDLSIGSRIESLAAPIEVPADLPELKTDFAPPPSTVHAIATSPAEIATTEATSVEPPRPLPNVEHAEPVPAEQPREDVELRAFIRDELQTLAASEHDVWYETLRGLSREDATEILRIWKLTRGVGSGPISPELKKFASLSVEKLISQPPAATLKPDPAELEANGTGHDDVRRLCRLNLANASTPGFKSRELMIFEQTDATAPEALPPAASDIWINVSQGKLTKTQRVLDCAIDGPGFFQVKRGEQTLLTRCGRFVLDDEGRIALPRSHGAPCPLEPAIMVPKNCERLQIRFTGEVTVVFNGSTQSLGTIPLFSVFDSAALEPAGDNLFNTTAASGSATPIAPAECMHIMQGSIEESNVDAAAEQRKLDALANSPL